MMKKRIISLALVVVILLLMSSQVFCIGYESEYKENAVASNDLVVIVPGIVGSELVDIDDIKVWVGVGLLASKIDCNEVGNPVYPLRAYNDDNYGALDTYKKLFDELNSTFSNRAVIKFFPYDWRKTNTISGQSLKNLISQYSGKIIIVAHSMGGIVASEYLRIATPSQRSRTTLITLGTPFTGAPKAVQVMEDGKMFPGIAGDITSSYIKNMIRNFPAAFELLPTDRSNAYVQVNGVDQKNADAWSIMKQRPWAKVPNGSLKPMMDKAVAFHSGLMQTNGPHYSLSAGNSIFISSLGYTTVQKVNYTKNGNTYSVSSYVTTNNGDGTVPASSAQNKLPNNNANVVIVNSGGNHTGMLSNNTTLAKVMLYISQTLAGISINSIVEDETAGHIVENERGWLIGDGFDGKRIRVIIRGGEIPSILKNDGSRCTLEGDILYGENSDYVGNCWKVGDGYQFEMMNDKYTFIFNDGGDNVNIEVMYMENGYFNMMETFEIDGKNEEYRLEVGDCVESEAVLTAKKGVVIQGSMVADERMLAKLNAD